MLVKSNPVHAEIIAPHSIADGLSEMEAVASGLQTSSDTIGDNLFPIAQDTLNNYQSHVAKVLYSPLASTPMRISALAEAEKAFVAGTKSYHLFLTSKSKSDYLDTLVNLTQALLFLDPKITLGRKSSFGLYRDSLMPAPFWATLKKQSVQSLLEAIANGVNIGEINTSKELSTGSHFDHDVFHGLTINKYWEKPTPHVEWLRKVLFRLSSEADFELREHVLLQLFIFHERPRQILLINSTYDLSVLSADSLLLLSQLPNYEQGQKRATDWLSKISLELPWPKN